MSCNQHSTPKTPATPVRISSDRTTPQAPQAPYRPTIDRIVSDTTGTTSARDAVDTLPSCRAPQFNQHGNPSDVMNRVYDPPKEALDIEQALRLPPQPKTFKRHLDDLKMNGEPKKARMMTDEDRKAEFERVKNSLKGWGQNPWS